MPSARCVWCGGTHEGPLVLCDACEQLAAAYRRGNALPVRQIANVSEEPDD